MKHIITCQEEEIDERDGGGGGGKGGRRGGKGKNILTSHVNCLEETSHHEVPHGMFHMLLLGYCGIGQIEQRRHKSRIMHCSAFHDEYDVIRS